MGSDSVLHCDLTFLNDDDPHAIVNAKDGHVLVFDVNVIDDHASIDGEDDDEEKQLQLRKGKQRRQEVRFCSYFVVKSKQSRYIYLF